MQYLMLIYVASWAAVSLNSKPRRFRDLASNRVASR
jgi:hypothetical protein